MANIFRLGNRRLLQKIRIENYGILTFVRPITLKPQVAPPIKSQNHDERNMELGRPQSPHLTIYAPQWTSMLSISHRATGMALAGYTILFGLGAIVLPDSIPNYLDALADSNIGNGVLITGKVLLSFPFAYHFWNGIRHLTWDLGLFLSLKEVYATGYAMLALTFATTAALSAL